MAKQQTADRGPGRGRARFLVNNLMLGGLLTLVVSGVANLLLFENGNMTPAAAVIVQTVLALSGPLLTAGLVGLVLLALGVGHHD